MPTLTVYPTASADDGILFSSNASWLTARAGSSLTVDTNNTADTPGINRVSSTYEITQAFFGFDTSSIGGANSVSLVTFSVYISSVDAAGSWTMDLRAHDWGASLGTGDWVAGADWSSKTLCGTKAAGAWSASSYNAFASTAEFRGAVNRTGTTRLVMCSENLGGTSAPTALEEQAVRMSDISGTTEDPKLYVEYAPAGTAVFLGCNF